MPVTWERPTTSSRTRTSSRVSPWGPGAHAQAASEGGSPSAADDRPGSSTSRKRDGSPRWARRQSGHSSVTAVVSDVGACGRPEVPRGSAGGCSPAESRRSERVAGGWLLYLSTQRSAAAASGHSVQRSAAHRTPRSEWRPPDASCSSSCRCHRTGANSAIGCRSTCRCARPETAGDRGPAHRPGCTMGRHRRPAAGPALACATWPPRGPRAPCARGPHAPRRRSAPAPMAFSASVTRQLHRVRTVDAVGRPVHARHRQVERDIDPTMGTGGVSSSGVLGWRTG